MFEESMSALKNVGHRTTVATEDMEEIAAKGVETTVVTVVAVEEEEEEVVVVVMVEDITMPNHRTQVLEAPLLLELELREAIMRLNMLSITAARTPMQPMADTRTMLPCIISTISSKVQVHNLQLLELLVLQHSLVHPARLQALNQLLHHLRAMLLHHHLPLRVALQAVTMRLV
jgi:hypothetical protein